MMAFEEERQILRSKWKLLPTPLLFSDLIYGGLSPTIPNSKSG
jgi:hypothetical protein